MCTTGIISSRSPPSRCDKSSSTTRDVAPPLGAEAAPGTSISTTSDRSSGPAREIVALDEALSRLFQVDETLAQVVVLRFFAGLTFDEVAENMGISLSTVKRKWKEARALLYRELKRDVDP